MPAVREKNGVRVYPSREAARLIGIGRNTLMERLRSLGLLKDRWPTSAGYALGMVWLEDSGYGGQIHGATWYSSDAICKIATLLGSDL